MEAPPALKAQQFQYQSKQLQKIERPAEPRFYLCVIGSNNVRLRWEELKYA